MNLSKMVAQDVPLFLSLLADLFPHLPPPPKADYPTLEAALKISVDNNKLVYHPNWVGKVLQLYDTTLVRHGIMLVGPSGGGKTQIFKNLRASLDTVTGTTHTDDIHSYTHILIHLYTHTLIHSYTHQIELSKLVSAKKISFNSGHIAYFTCINHHSICTNVDALSVKHKASVENMGAHGDETLQIRYCIWLSDFNTESCLCLARLDNVNNTARFQLPTYGYYIMYEINSDILSPRSVHYSAITGVLNSSRMVLILGIDVEVDGLDCIISHSTVVNVIRKLVERKLLAPRKLG